MLCWETVDQNPSLDHSTVEFATIWRALPKVVFSATLSAVQGNARLASGSVADEIERLRSQSGDGDIAIGGATLAAEAASIGLIDEYRARVYPVLVGGGVPFFPQGDRRTDLELIENRSFQFGGGLPPLPRSASGGRVRLTGNHGRRHRAGQGVCSGTWSRPLTHCAGHRPRQHGRRALGCEHRLGVMSREVVSRHGAESSQG